MLKHSTSSPRTIKIYEGSTHDFSVKIERFIASADYEINGHKLLRFEILSECLESCLN